MADVEWALKGELVLSCNCTVFCPCVLSLGQHPPTEGYCQTWAGFRVDNGYYGDTDLSGLNLGLIMEIPGYMSRGNWTAGLFVDKRASIYATKAFTKIFTGKAGGTTSLLVDPGREFPRRATGADQLRGRGQEANRQDSQDHRRRRGADSGQEPRRGHRDLQFRVLDRAGNHRRQIRAFQDCAPFGRNWNFAGRSAEICKLDWSGPN
jgi:hypothetical protein